jgi:hypothetical protein
MPQGTDGPELRQQIVKYPKEMILKLLIMPDIIQ